MGHRDRGAVAVETAVVSMFLVTVLFGIVESSFLFKDSISVSASARAGARMGASQPRSPSFAQDSADQVTNSLSDLNPGNLEALWIYKTTGSSGMPDSGSFASCTVCVKFIWHPIAAGSPGSPGSLVQSSGNWPSTSQNACAGDSARDALGVYLKYKHTAPLGLFFNNMYLTESTVMWIEPTTAAVCKP